MVSQHALGFYASRRGPTNVSLFVNLLCVGLEPLGPGSADVTVSVFSHAYKLTQYLSESHTQYCTAVDRGGADALDDIIIRMRGNAPVAPHVTMLVDSDVVGDVDFVVYQVPDQGAAVWCCLAAITALAAAHALLFHCCCKVRDGFVTVQVFY